MLGWLTKNQLAVQILPNLVPMQFNTALGFLLAGTALLVYRRHNKMANTCALLLAFIGLLTLLQYAFSINLKIDTLFIEPFVSTKTLHPGRMAPNTALCFVLFSLFIYTSKMKLTKFWFIGAALPCIYGILGSISLAGYLLNVEQAYSWGSLTHMALHTSVGFLVLSVASVILFFKEKSLTNIQREMVYDFSVFTFVLFSCFVIWLSIKASMVNNMHESLENYANVLSSKISVKIESEIEAIVRFFTRYDSNTYSTTVALQNDADAYFQHMPFLLSFDLKANGKTTEIQLLNPRQDVNQTKVVAAACNAIKNAGSATKDLFVKDIFIGNTSYLCVKKYGLSSVVNLSGVLQRYVAGESDKFNIFITETNKSNVVLRDKDIDQEFIKYWSKESRVVVHGNSYIITVSPKQEYIDNYIGHFPFYVVIMSILLACLMLIVARNKRQLTQKESALKHSETVKFTLLNSLGESIIGINNNLKVNFMNQSAQSLLQYPYSATQTVSISDLLSTDSKISQRPLIDYIERSITASEMIKNDIEYIVTKQNTVIPVSFSVSPIIEEGKTQGAIIVLFDISERVKYEENLKEIAFYDQLTKLPNRYSLLKQIDAAISRAERENVAFALCFIDVNKFKMINDTHGHHIGDKALQFVAEKLAKNIRKNDFLSRLAGDEFCLILDGINSEEKIKPVIDKLKTAVEQPFTFKDQSLVIQLSIGYVIYSEGFSAQELLIKADHEMYKYKSVAKRA